MGRYTGILGLVVMLAIAWLLSNNKRKIPWRIIIWGLTIQILLALALLKTDVGLKTFEKCDKVVTTLLDFSKEGGAFLWTSYATGKIEPGLVNFVVTVLPTVIFFSSLMAILYHLGIMQFVVKMFAWVLQRTMGTSGSETLSCSANVFVGQTEAPLLVRPFVNGMTKSELLTIMTGGFATVAGGVMALYVQWLQGAVPGIAGHLMAASVMSAPAAIVIAKIMYPETEKSETAGTMRIHVEKVDDNAVEALARGATDGMKLAINIAAMLVAFVAMLALVNHLLETYAGTTIEQILGRVFSGLAFVMGAEWGAEAQSLGRLLGEKIVLTELVAYKNLADPEKAGLVLSDRTRIIASYALCGFANFASVGIQLGGIGALAPDRRKDLAALSLRALVAGALASWTTACIAGVLID